MSLDAVQKMIRETMRALRPTMATCVSAMGAALERIPGAPRPMLEGPDSWSWVDDQDKTFMLSPSPEHDGHPLLTIRQPIAKDLDTWITTCSLVIGPDRGPVLSSITLILVNHTGAFAGLQSTVQVVSSTGDPMQGLNHALKLAGKDPAENSAIANAILKGGDGKGGVN